MHFDKTFIMSVLPKSELIYDAFVDDVNFAIDSRTLKNGEAFIAIVGKNTDGHNYLSQALENGACGLVISKKESLKSIDKNRLKDKFVLLVEDTVEALKKLATAWRVQFNYPVIGITGSVGKTTTRQILGNILKLNGANVLVTQGNQNSVIGLPLNILRMRKEHEIAVFELGINQRGEMAQLVEMAKPTIAVITAIGHSHMEGLGSISDVSIEKREIFKLFKENNIGVINGDQIQLATIGYSHPVIKFGSKITNQIQARKIKIIGSEINFVLKIYKSKYNIVLINNHIGYINNCMAAIAVGCLLNIPNDIMIKAISIPIVEKGRFQFQKIVNGSGQIIDDCYNASPESMKAALLTFEKIETKAKKVAILGDMLELGNDSSFWHRQIGRFIRKVPSLNHLILVGNMVKFVKTTLPVGVSVEVVPSWSEALTALENRMANKEEYLVLVKGSTGGYTSGLANLVKCCTQNNVDNNIIEMTSQFNSKNAQI